MKEYEIRDSLGDPKKVAISADTSPINRRHPKMFRVKCTGKYKPTRGSEGAAGFDLYNNGGQVIVGKGLATKVHTGCHFEIPEGYVGLLFVRSSIGVKRLITLANGTGIIDSDYRGEVLAMVQYNGPNKYVTIEEGERFAQLVVVPYAHLGMRFVDELDETTRGEGGFGSTGTK